MLYRKHLIIHRNISVLFKRYLNMEHVSNLQIKQMNDQVPLVDEQDVVLGPSTKRNCHERSTHQNGILHRAFSVFLFDSNNRLLLQQRSASKITFPNYYTNSCCSHPRYNEEELNEDIGIKVAAQRRMNYELGIPISQVPINKLHLLTKIHYFANADKNWCEHEMDYVLFCKADVDLSNVNKDEVQKTMYLTQDELRQFLRTKDTDTLITPWFQYIVDNFIFNWWDKLDCIEVLNDNMIHRAGDQS